MGNQITLSHGYKVTCSCGFYDKSLNPRQLARIHNTRQHGGKYQIYDAVTADVISQLTGRPKES